MASIFDEIRRMQREMERLFDRLSRVSLRFPEFDLDVETEIPAEAREPFAEMQETESEVIVRLEMPGLSKEDIQLVATADTLEVKAVKKHEATIEKEGMMRAEKAYRSFYRKLRLPCKVKPEEAKARYEAGILEVRLPKAEESKGNEIDIE